MPDRPHGGIGWRVSLTAADEGAEDIEEVRMYCQRCAEEFHDSWIRIL